MIHWIKTRYILEDIFKACASRVLTWCYWRYLIISSNIHHCILKMRGTSFKELARLEDEKRRAGELALNKKK